jgi:hypothetical protein
VFALFIGELNLQLEHIITACRHGHSAAKGERLLRYSVVVPFRP